jgi:CDP-diacylglycerol--glycerol-3-phosphate 3-phosphatidyltransferase
MDRVFLWAIPRWVPPNALTVVRLLLIPVVLVLFQLGHAWWAVGVFWVAAVTDALDGAMARIRHQQTNLGRLLDPLADKLLIGVLLYSVGFEYLITKIMLAAIGAEVLVMVAAAAANREFRANVPPSNVFGKLKMAFQTGGVLLFLIGTLAGGRGVSDAGAWLLWVSLAFVALSAVDQFRARRRGTRNAQPSP